MRIQISFSAGFVAGVKGCACGFILIAILLAGARPAIAANERPDVARIFCPDIISQGARTGPGEIDWSLECVLRAIIARRRDVLRDLLYGDNAPAACDRNSECDGFDVLTRQTDRFVFGDGAPSIYNDDKLTLRTMLSKASTVDVTYDVSSDGVSAMVVPRPGPKRAIIHEGWMKHFFVCTFKYSDKRQMWLLQTDVCFSEAPHPMDSEKAITLTPQQFTRTWHLKDLQLPP
jgi:hypothetical protein